MATGPRARVEKLARRVKVAAEYERASRARRSSVDPRKVMYESFSGNGMLCNPEAIFRELLAAPDMKHLRHVWALSDLEEYADTVAEFAGNPRVEFVTHKSHAYYSALATSKYLVNNATFPPQFGKREDQVYVNTWHGTPIKAMGYDIPGGAYDTRNVVRNMVAADYMLAPNEATEHMYLHGYRMRNIYRGAIVAEGTPRVDKQFADEGRKDRIRAQLRARGVVIGDDQDLILYAPTWKGTFYSPTNDIRQLRARLDALAAQIDGNRHRVLLKVHQQVYTYAIGHPDLREMLVPNEIPTNDVLAVTDTLVTDYSSIFIDFLATGRPVLFYTPDLDDYTSSRGLYLPPDEFPGPVCRDLEELAAQIKHLGSGDDIDATTHFADRYATLRERYCPKEDGGATARLVDLVFRGNERSASGEAYDVRRDFSDGRIPVLVHLGGMLANGITSSALSLLDNIDYDRFDVSATFPDSTSPDRLRLMALINPRVRLFPRMGGINGSKLQVRTVTNVKNTSARTHQNSVNRQAEILHEEWVRCFGASRFEHIVDFSGYAPFWVKLLASRPYGSFSLWLHNDIAAELKNAGRSDYLRASLTGVTALYGQADHIVSVSEALYEVNARNLAAPVSSATPDRFTYARNTINYRRIQRMAYGAMSDEARGLGLEVAQRPRTPVSEEALTKTSDLPQAMNDLVKHFGMGNVYEEVDRRRTLATVLPDVPPGTRTFVTAGRLSPEKNHLRMVRAFDLVHQENPNTRLVILGTGPLKIRLEEEIEELGLASAVLLAGHEPNPYVVFAHADCFVLSSDYEGQPMVLLEAMILGLPIVSTAFDSVRGALPEGTGLVVARDVKALAGGMRAFLRGEVPTKAFDYKQYNRDATEEFYRAIGAGVPAS